jgi:hypothetical protein
MKSKKFYYRKYWYPIPEGKGGRTERSKLK